MSIRRRKKTKAFTQIDNAALRNPALSLKAKGLLAVMMSCPEDWQFYMSWLEKQSRDGTEAHQNAMKELETQGYVQRERGNGKGGRLEWDYFVDDEPHGKPEPTIGGKARHGDSPTIGGFTTDGLTTHGKPGTSNTDLKKTDLNKKGGEYNLVDNAGAEAQPQPQALSVAQPAPAQSTTSEDAALNRSTHEGEPHSLTPEALPLPQLPSPPTAVLEGPAPDGVTAGAVVEDLSLTDEEVEFIFGTGSADETKALEQIAGGGAAADGGQEGVADDAVEPHDPESTRAVLVPALGGQSKLNGFMEEVPPGLRGKSRRAWVTEISPERAIALVNQGRLEAGAANPWTFIIRLLDVEIGSVIGGKSAGREPVTPLPGAYLTAAEKEALATHYPAVTAGEQWQSRKSGKKFEIEEVTSQTVFVLDLGEYTLQKFHATFEPAEASA